MELNVKQKKLTSDILSGRLFALYLFKNLPIGWLAGLRVRELSGTKCVTSVPFKWLNKNPFKSVYFAVQSMAAELSTATGCLLATHGEKPSIAIIIINMKATFIKKATDKVFFECHDIANAFSAVEECIQNSQASIAKFKTVGKMKDGTIVSEFEFTWSFKQRKS